jgi:RecB family endonuclease NucS
VQRGPVAADDVETEEGILPPGAGAALRFGLERHLHEFLRDNWDRTCLGKEWRMYAEEGNLEAGYEYPCGVGRIDILARHWKKRSWLVVELKRDQTSDTTVGQVLRYMGWVKHHLAAPGEQVAGLIIARQDDDALQYALSNVQGVDLQLYEVDFRLLAPGNRIGAEPKRRK